MVAPITVSPTLLVTGIDSPVSIDSSTCDAPSITVAIDRDLVAGPDHDDVAGQDLGGGHFDLLAVAQHGGLGRRQIHSARIASDAPARARISSQWPSRMNTSSTAAAS